MEKGKWQYHSKLGQLNAAQAWGCPTPSAYFDLSKDDKLDILAWYEAKWRMDAVNTHEMRLKSKPRKQPKK